MNHHANPEAPDSALLTEQRLALRAHGYNPVPLAGKAVTLKGWQRRTEATEHEIRSWALTHPAQTNTGILTKNNPAFDIDILSRADVADAAADVIAAELAAIGGRVMVRFGCKPKRAILCRTNEPFKKIKVELDSFFADPDTGEVKYDAIEILGDGQQLACLGIHPDTSEAYEWVGGAPTYVPASKLPLITEADARAIVDRVVVMLGERFGVNVRTPAKATRPDTPAAEAKTTDVATVWGAAALDSACDMIANAESGSQEATLNGQCYGVGQLVAGGELPEGEALSALRAAAEKIPDHDPTNPWKTGELARKVERSFTEGKASPRAAPKDESLAFTFRDGAGAPNEPPLWTPGSGPQSPDPIEVMRLLTGLEPEELCAMSDDELAAWRARKRPEVEPIAQGIISASGRFPADVFGNHFFASMSTVMRNADNARDRGVTVEASHIADWLEGAIDTILLPDDKVGAQSQPFPVWALGPVLEGTTTALVESAQCRPSLAASSLFAHAAGAVQAIVDVRTVRGKLLTTVALIAIAESSEGKSLVWAVAAAPFHEFDKWLETEHAEIDVDYRVKMAFWKKEYDAAAGATAKPDEVKAAIEKLAEIERRKPVKPNFPSVTFPGGGTLEGLINSLKTQVPSSVSSTAEGAQFFRGAAFGDKNAAASASMAIDLIDTGGGGRDLMGDGSNKGRIRLRDKRFSQIMAVQPAVIAPVLAELEQAGQGYHARYLKVAPEPIAHEREFDSLSVTRIDQDPRVLAYSELMRLMLHSARFGLGAHPLEAHGVEPLELTLSRDATIIHDRFAKEMAHQAGPGKRYSAPSVTEVAKKTAERALRFAGVLYTVDAFARPLPQRDASDPWEDRLTDTELRLVPCEIGVDVMERAITLARWFLEEERRYYLVLTQAPESKAERIPRLAPARPRQGRWRLEAA